MRIAVVTIAATVALGVLSAGASSAAAEEWCPPSFDKAFKEGARLPEQGSYCMPPPQFGNEVCRRDGSLPAALRLRVDGRAAGVGLETSRSTVCREWGAPRIAVRTDASAGWTYIYGSSAPTLSSWVTYQRTNAMIAFIASWCRYHHPQVNPEDPDPACEDGRMAQRQAVMDAGGPLTNLLEVDVPQRANWVEVQFTLSNKVSSITSWRGSDVAHGLRPGGRFPEGDRCQTLAGFGTTSCVAVQRTRRSRCLSAFGRNDPPMGGGSMARYVGRPPVALGDRLRVVGISVKPMACRPPAS